MIVVLEHQILLSPCPYNIITSEVKKRLYNKKKHTDKLLIEIGKVQKSLQFSMSL